MKVSDHIEVCESSGPEKSESFDCDCFPESAKDGMRSLISKTADNRREYGVRFYSDCSLGEVKSGSYWDAPIPSSRGALGHFHTHPPGVKENILRPSESDISSILSQKYAVMCIGSVINGNPVARCWGLDKNNPHYKRLAKERKELQQSYHIFMAEMMDKYDMPQWDCELLKGKDIKRYLEFMDKFNNHFDRCGASFNKVVIDSCGVEL